jgi:hypothetical protein
LEELEARKAFFMAEARRCSSAGDNERGRMYLAQVKDIIAQIDVLKQHGGVGHIAPAVVPAAAAVTTIDQGLLHGAGELPFTLLVDAARSLVFCSVRAM